jgi:23S rRNA pseudouridine2605 synthase
VVTEKDPEGRPTVFESVEEKGLPRVVSVGRLDINTEGLLLLTNDGGLKRILELPATGWLRKYRVRAHGTVTQAQLDSLKKGVTVDGVKYGPIDAKLERDQGANVWIEVALREGKNREVKNVLMQLGLEVNRLIRISFGPFQLGDLPVGGIEVVKARVLKDQLGKRLAEEAEVDFDSDLPAPIKPERRPRAAAPAAAERDHGRGIHTTTIEQHRFRFTDRAEMTPAEAAERRAARPMPTRPGSAPVRGRPAPKKFGRDEVPAPERHIHFDDGREPTVFEEKNYGKKARPEEGAAPRRDRGTTSAPARDSAGQPRGARPMGDRPPRSAGGDADRPRSPGGFRGKPRADGDKPARPYGDKPARTFDGKPRAPRADGERPARSFGDKPARSVGDKPSRTYGDKPARGAGDRPKSFGDRPARSGDGPKSFGDKPPRAFKPRAPRPDGDARPASDRPARSPGGKPARSFADKPARSIGGGKPAGAPRGPRPTGSGPRPPRKDGAPPRKDGPRPPSRPRSK